MNFDRILPAAPPESFADRPMVECARDHDPVGLYERLFEDPVARGVDPLAVLIKGEEAKRPSSPRRGSAFDPLAVLIKGAEEQSASASPGL